MPIENAISRLKHLDQTEGYIRDTEMWAVADAVDWIEKTLAGGYSVPQVATENTPVPQVNVKVEGSTATAASQTSAT